VAATEVTKLFTRKASDDLQNHRTYERVYEVVTDDPTDDEQVVGNASVGGVTVPVPGDPLDSDPEAICVGVDPEQSDDSDTIWYVTVNYDSDPPTATGARSDRPDARTDVNGNTIPKGERQQNPLNEPATWTLEFVDTEEPADEGTPVKYDGTLQTLSLALWAALTRYSGGALAQRGTNVYRQTATEGVSGTTGPSGTGSAIADSPAAWAGATAYAEGDIRANGGVVYRCETAGTSAGAGGPTGTGATITDGTAVWSYYGLPATWSFYATAQQVANDPAFAPLLAILNSAGLPFDPPVMVPVSKLVLSVTANMPIDVADMRYLLRIKNGVNRFAWHGIPPRCAKILNATSDGGKVLNEIPYSTVKWQIALDPDTFDLRILDSGKGYIETRPDGERVFTRFVDGTGEKLDDAMPLNGAGRPLEPDAKPVYRRYVPRQLKIIDFNKELPF
jgi:hypothetical protein